MQWFEAAILGVIQGITEFLPISSSGHVWLAERVLFHQPADMAFMVFTHLASLLAVLVFLRRELLQLSKNLYKANGNTFYDRTLALQLIWATAITAICGLLLKDFVTHDMNEMILLISLICTSVIVVVSAYGRVRVQECSWSMMTLLGLIQGLAVLPGISRSGVTIGMLLLWGLPRKKAVDISFLLSVPVITGTFLLFLPDLDTTVANISPYSLLLSFALTFMAAYLVIYLLRTSLDKIWKLCGIWCLLLAAVLAISIY